MTMTTILITGIAGQLATLVAGALVHQPGVRVVGVDRVPLRQAIDGVETYCAELRGELLLDVLRTTAADVVVHLAQVGEEYAPDGRESAVQGNVIATMELLGACESAGVRRVVLRSSTLVYGLRHDLPAFVGESMPLCTTMAPGLVHNYVEIEQFAADFATKHGDMAIVVLRCAGVLGDRGVSPLARYFAQPTPPMLLGFDPRIQVVHVEDAAAAFALAAVSEGTSGAFHVAAEGPVTLLHALQLVGRRPLPLVGPLLRISQLLGRTQVLGEVPFDSDFLRYACVVDCRRAREVLGWQPQYSAEEALRLFAPQRAEALTV